MIILQVFIIIIGLFIAGFVSGFLFADQMLNDKYFKKYQQFADELIQQLDVLADVFEDDE